MKIHLYNLKPAVLVYLKQKIFVNKNKSHKKYKNWLIRKIYVCLTIDVFGKNVCDIGCTNHGEIETRRNILQFQNLIKICSSKNMYETTYFSFYKSRLVKSWGKASNLRKYYVLFLWCLGRNFNFKLIRKYNHLTSISALTKQSSSRCLPEWGKYRMEGRVWATPTSNHIIRPSSRRLILKWMFPTDGLQVDNSRFLNPGLG